MDLHRARQENRSQGGEVQGAALTGELAEVAMGEEGIGQAGDVVILILNEVRKVVRGHGARLAVVGTQVAWNSICLQPSMLPVTNNQIVLALCYVDVRRRLDIGDVFRSRVLMRCSCFWS